MGARRPGWRLCGEASRLVLSRGRRAGASCVLPPCARCAHLPSPLPAFRPPLASAVCLSHSRLLAQGLGREKPRSGLEIRRGVPGWSGSRRLKRAAPPPREPALMCLPLFLSTGGSRCERRRLGQTPEEASQ